MNERELNKFLTETYKLKSIIRYNNTPHLVNESIAEHQYFVALIVYKLYDKYNFDLYIALKMALFHDIPEIFLSDTPHNTKTMFPKIAAAAKDSQKIASDMIDPSMTPLVEDYEHQKTIEARIVRIADILSVIQYTKQEVKLGNKYMSKIYDDTKKYLNKLYEKIKEYER